MSNDCSGTLRIVARKKEVLSRVREIGNYRDKEYFLSRCKSFIPIEPIAESDGYYIQDFSVCGAWNCSRFFTENEDESQRNTNGAHLSNLQALAYRLGFGAELFAEEIGFGFCEHYAANHYGVMTAEEVADYTMHFPRGKDGLPDYDADCQYDYGDLNDGYGEYMPAQKIYGQ